MITKTIHVSTRIVISCAMESGIPFGVLMKVKGNLGKVSEFANRGEVTVEQVRVQKKEIKARE